MVNMDTGRDIKDRTDIIIDGPPDAWLMEEQRQTWLRRLALQGGSVVLGREKDVPSGGFLVYDEGEMTAEDWERLRRAVDTPRSGVFRVSVAWDIYRSLRQQAAHLEDVDHPAPE